MKYVPHDYQRYVTNYIETHPACAVLLDMGLGKTSITLTALLDLLFDTFEAHRILVIAPLRVARDTWPAEIEKWDHLKLLTYSVAVGSEKDRRVARDTWPSEIEKWDHLKLLTYSVAVGSEKDRITALKRPADIYIINRENVQWLVEQSGIPFDFDTVIVDELSSFKSHQSKRFKALMRVRPRIKRIVGLTGTPSARTASWTCGQNSRFWTWVNGSDALSGCTATTTSPRTSGTARSSTPTSSCPVRTRRSTSGSRISPFP